MKLAAVPGITPVTMDSLDATAAALTDLLVSVRGPESAHDPGVALAARDAAELAHENGASLVAVVEHAQADPAILVGMVVTADSPLGPGTADELARHLSEGEGHDLREVTSSVTGRGYPVVIAERILLSGPPTAGARLQAVVVEPEGRRMAVFTLHSTTGRGWLELAAVLGRLVSSVDFTHSASSLSR